MTSYTIYAGTSDHTVSCTSTNYATARAGTGSKTDDTTGYLQPGQIKSGADYYCQQASLNFDTSAVPAGTPADVSLSLYVQALASGSDQFKAGERTLGGGTADFVAGASLGSLTLFGTLTSLTASAYNVMSSSLNPARSATYGLILWGKKQQDNTAPTTDEAPYICSANFAGTAQDPKLTIVMPEPIGRADETDTAYALTPALSIDAGRVDETDSAYALTPAISIDAGRADETDTAFALDPILPPSLERTARLNPSNFLGRTAALIRG